MSITASRRCSRRRSRASASTRRTTSSCIRDGGGILFTDPGYGSHWYYEGTVRELELPTSVYHIDAQRRSTHQADRRDQEAERAVLLARLSHPLRRRHGADALSAARRRRSSRGTSRTTAAGLTNRREFATLDAGFHDGIRADVDGNLWCGTGFGGDGVDGVHVYAPDGTRIGQIVMPEGTANLCFVGKNRNRLFMTSSQSVYTLYTAAQGAHIT